MRSAERLAVPLSALDPAPARRLVPALTVVLIAMSGFALTLAVFWPGVMTFDARFVLAAARAGIYGDWQSPVMAALWRAIDPLVPGAAGMLLTTALLYWLGFALVGLALARRAPWLGVVTVVLGLAPPGFMFLGILWRDVLFGSVWFLAAALAFVAMSTRLPVRPALQIGALGLVILGVLLRPNAIFAAPILVVYALWPARFEVRRTAILYGPAGLALFGLLQLVYYGVLGAAREHPEHSLAVFDLGGITHFSGDIRLPGAWTPEEKRRLATDCYDPYLWDAYWYNRPCAFVMERLEQRDGVFGTPALTLAWRNAVAAHPRAWLTHRAAFTEQFLLRENFTLWVLDLDDKTRLALPDNHAFAAMLAVHDVLKPTPLFRVGAWLVVCSVVAAFAWRRREEPSGAYALAVSGAAIVYVASFAVLGVAADVRYAWFAVPAGLTGGAALLAAGLRRR
ncbi:MAG: hypothetical protein HXX10_12435 [Rhodoplanes sp.]|uniref:hypothetical protein n=1 Tax=Rhodoplanes sp. TaxID=1968906 RepID=UPI001820A140|nr:hypothetical protein [Rhodoplanes sp.]NVO14834.1 hypothetical protein [Rhodoplanes sp.]